MRKFKINVNGNQYEVEVEEVTNGETSIKKSAKTLQSTSKVQKSPSQSKPESKPSKENKEVVIPTGAETIEAPMPGTILKVNTKQGDTVKEGQVLAILEAMKMENEIVCPKDGKTVDIAVTEGTSVNTGDKLIIVE